MAMYSYKGINREGKEIKGVITAEGLAQAKQRAHAGGIMLMEIKEKTSAQSSPLNLSRGSASSVKIADLSLMTRQLATLIKAKIPIAEALSALVDQVDHPGLRIVLSEVKQKINEGASLAKSLSDYPKVFNNVYVNMVEAGEASGTLDVVLLRLAEFTEGQSKLKNKIMSAMLYPIIMAFAGTAMMTFIFIVIIPKISRIFESMKKDLPLPTKICLAISHFLQNYWWAVLIAIPIIFAMAKKYFSTQKGRSQWHRWQLKLPIFGNIIAMVNIGRFCSTLSTLLTSGVPILASLRIVRNLITNVHMQSAVEAAKDSVSEGASLATPLINSGFFPPLVTHMIKLGEKSGELEQMLKIVAENYEDQVNTKLDGLTSVLEPIMMILLGGAVAFIVGAVIVPIMDLTSLKR